ncbi:MAG: YciI family protein [Anaerolineales bacterium]|nr:YciI family protein [Anaerolineales bacterium]
MHYLLLIHGAENPVEGLSPEQITEIIAGVERFDREITGAGQNLGSIRLQPAGAASVVRLRQGEAITTDGPFMEAKEQLGGIYIIEAEDQAEAVRIAQKLPMAGHGTIEVRPVLGIDLRGEALVMYDGE